MSLSSTPLSQPNASSSFAQILNRTQQNLNKINQRYAANSSAHPNSLVAASPALQPRFSSGGKLGAALDDVKAPIAISSNPGNQASALAGSTKSSGRMVSIDENVLGNILDRLLSLEARTAEDHSQITKILMVEKQQQMMEKNLDTLSFDFKDLNRQISSQNSKIQSMVNTVEHVQKSYDSKQQQILAFDNYIKDNEQWRANIEQQLLSAAKDAASSKALSGLNGFVQASDYERHKSQLPLLVNQHIHSILNLYQENLQNQVNTLTKKMEILTSSGGEGNGGAAGVCAVVEESRISDSHVQALIAKEVLLLQNNLEDRLQRNISRELESGMARVKEVIGGEVRGELVDIYANLSPQAESSPQKGKKDLKSAVQEKVMREQERMYKYEQDLNRKYHQLEKDLDSFQAAYRLDCKTSNAKISVLENKVEGLYAQYDAHKQDGESKLSEMHKAHKNIEILCKDLVNRCKEEFTEQIYAHKQEALTERSTAEKRLQITEKLIQDCLYHLQYHNEILDKKIAAHPIYAQFQQSVQHMEQVEEDIKRLQQDITTNLQMFQKVQQNTVLQSDFLLIKEKVFKTELALKSQADNVEGVQKLLDSLGMVQSKVSTLEIEYAHLTGEVTYAKTHIHNLENTVSKKHVQLDAVSETVKGLQSALPTLEKNLSRELGVLREGAKGLGDRVGVSEGMVTVMHNTHNSEIQQIFMQLRYLEDRIGKGGGSMSNFTPPPFQSAPLPIPPQPVSQPKTLQPSSYTPPNEPAEVTEVEVEDARKVENEHANVEDRLEQAGTDKNETQQEAEEVEIKEDEKSFDESSDDDSEEVGSEAEYADAVNLPHTPHIPQETPESSSLQTVSMIETSTAPAAAAPSGASAAKSPVPSIPLLSLPPKGVAVQQDEAPLSITRISNNQTDSSLREESYLAQTSYTGDMGMGEVDGGSESDAEDDDGGNELPERTSHPPSVSHFAPPAQPLVELESELVDEGDEFDFDLPPSSVTAAPAPQQPAKLSPPPIPTLNLASAQRVEIKEPIQTRYVEENREVDIAKASMPAVSAPVDETDEFDYDHHASNSGKDKANFAHSAPANSSSPEVPSEAKEEEATVDTAPSLSRTVSNDHSVGGGSVGGSSVGGSSTAGMSMRERLRLRQEQLRSQRQGSGTGTADTSAGNSVNVSRTTSSNNLYS